LGQVVEAARHVGEAQHPGPVQRVFNRLLPHPRGCVSLASLSSLALISLSHLSRISLASLSHPDAAGPYQCRLGDGRVHSRGLHLLPKGTGAWHGPAGHRQVGPHGCAPFDFCRWACSSTISWPRKCGGRR
jgi:hypothetical protein